MKRSQDDISLEVKALKIGSKVRELRQKKHYTLQDVAAKTGLSKPFLSQIENDHVVPPVATLLKLATDSSIADPIRCDSLRALSLWNVGDEELAGQLLPILTEEEEPMPNVREATFAALTSLLAS